MSHNFISVIAKKLLGKMVEIYLGDDDEVLIKSETNKVVKSVLYGKLIEAKGECVSLEVSCSKGTNVVYINAWGISAIIEPKNGISMQDVFISSQRRIRK